MLRYGVSSSIKVPCHQSMIKYGDYFKLLHLSHTAISFLRSTHKLQKQQEHAIYK